MPYPHKPSQLKKKSKQNKEWIESTVLGVLKNSAFDGGQVTTNIEQIRKLYNYYDGIINEEDFLHITKPLDKARKVNLAGNLRYYNIIKPIVDTLVGEKSKRPINDIVYIENSDVDSYKLKAKKEAAVGYIQDLFLKELQANGIEIDENIGELPQFQEFLKKFNSTYRDIRAIRGQHALNYLIQDMDVEDKLRENMRFFLTTGTTASVKRIVDDNLQYDLVFPWDLDFDRSPKNIYIEDSDWAVVRNFYTFNDVLVNYQTKMKQFLGAKETKKLLEKLEADFEFNELPRNTYPDQEPNSLGHIALYEVFWTSYVETNIVTYLDEEEKVQQIELDPSVNAKSLGFKIIDEESEYRPEIWEAAVIDNFNGEQIVLYGAPCPIQRSLLSKKAGKKIPVNGRVMARHLTTPVSLVTLGIPFQILYISYMYRLEQSINKAKDSMLLMDIDFIPDNMDMDEFLFWMEKFGIGFIQSSKEGLKVNAQHKFEINLQSKLIQLLIEALNFILDSWERLSGVNSQRQGVINPYSGKGVTERAVVQSSNNTEEYFKAFENYQAKEFQSFLDWSKAIWLDGKKGQYIVDDKQQQFFEIDGLEHLESEYGIFVSNSSEEQENLSMVKELTQAFAQNGTQPSTIAEILKAKSFSQVIDKLKDIEEQMAQTQKQNSEQQQQMLQQQMELEDKKLQNKLVEKEMDIDGKLKVKEMDVLAKQDTYKDRELDIKEKELQEDIRSNKANEAIDRMQKKKQQ